MEELNQQDWIGKWAIYSPNKIAVKEHETLRSFTYAALNNAGGHLATYLTEVLKLSKGDRVAVLAEHCLEYVSLFAAAQKSGIVIVPLNYRLSSVELEYIIKDAEPSVVFYEEQFAGLIPEKSEGFTFPIEKLTENWNENTISHFKNTTLYNDDCIFLL